jgi:hypothetical protein
MLTARTEVKEKDPRSGVGKLSIPWQGRYPALRPSRLVLASFLRMNPFPWLTHASPNYKPTIPDTFLLGFSNFNLLAKFEMS